MFLIGFLSSFNIDNFYPLTIYNSPRPMLLSLLLLMFSATAMAFLLLLVFLLLLASIWLLAFLL
jgi:hypothetical protein